MMAVHIAYVEVLDPEQYKRRFEHFSNFYQAVKGKEYPTDCDRQYTLDRINNLLILGLNSAWQLDHHYKSRASIKPEALSNALDEIRNPETKIAGKLLYGIIRLTVALKIASKRTTFWNG